MKACHEPPPPPGEFCANREEEGSSNEEEEDGVSRCSGMGAEEVRCRRRGVDGEGGDDGTAAEEAANPFPNAPELPQAPDPELLSVRFTSCNAASSAAPSRGAVGSTAAAAGAGKPPPAELLLASALAAAIENGASGGGRLIEAEDTAVGCIRRPAEGAVPLRGG